MSSTNMNIVVPSLVRDHRPDFGCFTVEHQVFVAYLKRYLHQGRVLFRFIQTFPDLANPLIMATFIGMEVSRWAPVQNPSLKTVEQYSWGLELLDEFELNDPLRCSPLHVPKKGGRAEHLVFRENTWYLPKAKH